ncbi:hypothetical protein Sango_1568200, partial [Sesamum angolense]
MNRYAMASSSTDIPEALVTGSENESGNSRIQLPDHHGMVMISAPLNGNNWLSWSLSVRIALEGRDKLGYIDGTCARPTDGSANLRQWRITDSMARYGECDRSLLYKIQREIGSMTQGNRTVTAYYTSMKQLWDELACLMPPILCSCGKCTCGSNKAKTNQIEASQLIQFLTGLNESYDNIRNQILVLNPLPHVNKAYSMVLRVERQRQVNSEFIDFGDNSALMGRGYEIIGNFGPRNNLRRKGPVDKRHLTCEICHKTGRNKETCFKLHGFLNGIRNSLIRERKTGMTTKHILALGRQVGELYYLDKSSFVSVSPAK